MAAEMLVETMTNLLPWAVGAAVIGALLGPIGRLFQDSGSKDFEEGQS